MSPKWQKRFVPGTNGEIAEQIMAWLYDEIGMRGTLPEFTLNVTPHYLINQRHIPTVVEEPYGIDLRPANLLEADDTLDLSDDPQ